MTLILTHNHFFAALFELRGWKTAQFLKSVALQQI